MPIEPSIKGLVSAISKRLPLSGGVMTGFLTLNADPVNALHAVTKQYADALIGGGPPGPFVRTSIADTITAVHTFNPTVAGAPFILGVNAQGQLVTGLNADLLDSQSGAFYLARANHTGTQAPATISPQGSGSGLDADLLDGLNSTAFALAAHTHAPADITPQGSGSGLDADLLDGLHASAFQPIDADLTAYAALTTTGYVVRTGAGTSATRTLMSGSPGLDIDPGNGVSGDTVFTIEGDLAQIDGIPGNGFLVKTLASIWTFRSLVAPAAGLTISNPAGDLGSPAFALANDLAALEGLVSTGIAVRSAADTWVQRSIAVSGTGIAVANGSGVAGNPTLSLDALLDQTARVIARQNSGADVGARRRLNFIEGASTSITVVDDAGNEEIDVTIAVSGIGAGTVTSVAGGVGITNTPEPITVAGTVDLDINSLTTETALASGDLFPFVDVSVGTLPIAQRKVTLANLLVGLGGLGGDPFAQYLLLAGRTGTTNDAAITTSVGGTGSLAGGTDAGAILRLRASTSGAAHTGHIATHLDQIHPRTDLKTTTITTATDEVSIIADYGGLVIANTMAVVGFLGTFGTLEYTVPSAIDITCLRNKWDFLIQTIGGAFPSLHCFSNTPTFRVSGALVVVGSGSEHIGFNHAPSWSTVAGGTISLQTETAFKDGLFLSGAITGFTKFGYKMNAVSLAAGAVLDNYTGIHIEDFATTAINMAYRSIGANHGFSHGAWARFGSSSTTALGASVVIGAHGHISTFVADGVTPEIRWRDPGGVNTTTLLAQAQAGSITLTWPAAAPTVSGQVLSATTAGVMSWSDRGWNVVIVKSADQTVTNTTTLADDTELQFAVLANEVWHVELYLGMSGNNAASDAKWGFTSSVASFVVAQSHWEGVHYTAAAALTNVAPAAFASTTQAVTGGTASVDAGTSTTIWPVRATYRFRASANATVKVQFALLASPAAGRNAVMEAGSMLLARRIS
jgi:hypothetical protein